MTPEEFLLELNGYEGDDIWNDLVIPAEMYDERLTELLTWAETMDFISMVDGVTCLYIANEKDWDLTKIHSKLVYYWEEAMIGETTDFDVDAFERELNRSAPGIFERQESVSPSANTNDFVENFNDAITRIWENALEAV